MFFRDNAVRVATSLNEAIAKEKLEPRDPLHLSWAQRMETVGRDSVRYGLVLVLFWIGGMKFTAYEAAGITGFVANSPLMSWTYSLFSIQGFSALLGVTEIVIAVLIAARPISARAALVGSALAIGVFSTT